MATTQVSLEEYLRTDYEPDCDYVDGELEERNAGSLNTRRCSPSWSTCLRGTRRLRTSKPVRCSESGSRRPEFVSHISRSFQPRLLMRLSLVSRQSRSSKCSHQKIACRRYQLLTQHCYPISTNSAIFACHSFGPDSCTELPFTSTATVTGMSSTSNS